MKRLAATCAALLLVSACNKSEESNTTPPPSSPPQQTAPAVATPQEQGITWQLPAGWTQQEGTGMRMATLTSNNGLEISVIALGGEAGGTLANVNRWRGQLGLPPITESDLPKDTQQIPFNGGQATLADLTGPNPDSPRMLAAMVPAQDHTYFFKTTGPRDKVEQAKPGLIELIKSVKLQ